MSETNDCYHCRRSLAGEAWKLITVGEERVRVHSDVVKCRPWDRGKKPHSIR